MRLGYMAQISRTLGFDPGFNEAEAHAPRIPDEVPEEMSAAELASMRPRRMRLGYTDSQEMTDIGAYKLQ